MKAAQHVLKQITPAEAQAALLRLVRSNSIGFVINVPEGQTLKEPPTAFGAAIASLQSVPDVDMTRDAEEKAASTEKDALRPPLFPPVFPFPESLRRCFPPPSSSTARGRA